MANKKIAFQGADGRIVEIEAVDQGDGTYVLGSSAVIQTGDIEIGAVEIKNAGSDVRATVGANGLHVDVQASTGVGSLTEAAPGTDTASSGLNGRLQRIAQRITSLIALLPAALGANGGLKVEGIAGGVAQPVSGTFWQTTQPSSDAGAAWVSSLGVSGAAVVSADMTTAAPVTDAPTGGQKIVITDIIVSADVAMSVLFELETTGTDLVKIFLAAGSSAQFTPRAKFKLGTADKRLTAKASVAGNISVTCLYYSEV